jgi:hypothetical protein
VKAFRGLEACNLMTATIVLFMEIIAIYSENRTKPIHASSGRNAELFDVKAGGTFSDHYALKS